MGGSEAELIRMNGQRLEEVDIFKYLGATLSKDGSAATEVKARISLNHVRYDKACHHMEKQCYLLSS